ncbi:peptidase domain-containing ABC transporter [Chryseobacterium sp. SSA4.19]|uniref:peptidase domain-containing ABC transporter n=1 Tax=Chryseobacterium sp. SSA4.19 TaxID=2919915 RepID=UPI001F4DFFD9|nr:peptidase domain-containing ABC transporter [Chryseobacterium sp. SSA4.19]MCJ8154928.1 peptidase domain-containing ABC transporter [Chryseobacterium sp. SSA4.19]
MKFIPQHDKMDCGPSCLAMITSYYGKAYGLQYLRDNCFTSREGVSVLAINNAAEKIGFKTLATQISVEDLSNEFLPCILHWNQNHFIVLDKISTALFSRKKIYTIADPAHGILKLTEEKFEKSWQKNTDKGVALLLEPTDSFFQRKNIPDQKLSLAYIYNYLGPHKKQFLWLSLILLLGTVTTLAFPILTQKLIDDGVSKKDMGIITYILMAQLAFFVGNIVLGIFRNWIMLYVGSRLNISIISDFLKKLMSLPIKFFETKFMGDFNQRIQDHEKIELFLTSNSLVTIFSIFTFSVFFVVLWSYDFRILATYFTLTALSIIWSLYWLKKLKVLDYYRFQEKSENQESIYEIINGISEMKLNKFEDYKRKEWEEIQQKLFTINLRILKVDQIQLSGFEFLNQLKNIMVIFLSASFVIQGSMTLGALLSVSYIIGQMNTPVGQLITFFRSMQEAKLSLSRLYEVQTHPEEEQKHLLRLMNENYTRQNGIEKGIYFKNVSFQYEGPQSPFVLKDINLFIPTGKITAIVGASGSGKTTLIKLLLKFYEPTHGEIYFNHSKLKDISPKDLRQNCGVVMQDGHIFSDTIERNIATGDENIDQKRIQKALQTANIQSFVNELPLGLNTKIGASGNGISGGQKQRILIARAVYKDPQFILFDEATSALDAENEKVIHDNLQEFFKGKTVIIIAHRLSTVKNADQIIVLKHGKIVEQGNHQSLVEKKSDYFNLVKNQLELGA